MTGWKISRSDAGLLVTLAIPFAAVALFRRANVSTPFDALFSKVAGDTGIDAPLLKAIARVESNFNPNAISLPNRNGTRDFGMMQINEKTARGYGVDPASLVGDVEGSIRLAARVLSDDLKALGASATIASLISAYNQGARAVLTAGILNWPYVADVSWWQFVYSLQSNP